MDGGDAYKGSVAAKILIGNLYLHRIHMGIDWLQARVFRAVRPSGNGIDIDCGSWQRVGNRNRHRHGESSGPAVVGAVTVVCHRVIGEVVFRRADACVAPSGGCGPRDVGRR